MVVQTIRMQGEQSPPKPTQSRLQIGKDKCPGAGWFLADGGIITAPTSLPAPLAFQLLFLHNKTVRLSWDQPHRRKRRGEPWETYTERHSAMWVAEKGREAEDAAVRRAAQFEATGEWRLPEEPLAPELPPLHLVTGWSKAQPVKAVHNPGLALFGGWRLKNWKKREER